ncbi:8755_t:CDS:2, partial [Cetraspora pellucida]
GKMRMIINGKFFREIQCNCWFADERVQECDSTGVDVQVFFIVPVMFSYSAKPQHTLGSAHYLNDYIAQVCAEDPKRFIGSHINEWNLVSPELNPIWEACDELKVLVFVYSWVRYFNGDL